MLLTRREWPVLIANAVYVPLFLFLALSELNFEFILYVGVILIVAAWVLRAQRFVRFDLTILWGLTIWGFLHMAGGNLRVRGDILYNLSLLPIVPEPYHILRFDQAVHVFGFGVATLFCHHLLRPLLTEHIQRRGTLFFLVVLMGVGIGAVNEMIEFLAVVTVPETNVGGYENTALDLVFNTIGSVLAVVLVIRKSYPRQA